MRLPQSDHQIAEISYEIPTIRSSDSRNQLWNTPNQKIKSPQSASQHSQTVSVCSLCDELWNTNHTVYSMVIIKTRIHIIISFLALSSPWYNCSGWLGIKHQVTYSLAWLWVTLTSSRSCVLHVTNTRKRKCLVPKDITSKESTVIGPTTKWNDRFLWNWAGSATYFFAGNSSNTQTTTCHQKEDASKYACLNFFHS